MNAEVLKLADKIAADPVYSDWTREQCEDMARRIIAYCAANPPQRFDVIGGYGLGDSADFGPVPDGAYVRHDAFLAALAALLPSAAAGDKPVAYQYRARIAGDEWKTVEPTDFNPECSSEIWETRALYDRPASARPSAGAGEWPARWFASGPQGVFFAVSLKFAEALIADLAGADRDEWTVTDLSEGDTCSAPVAQAADMVLVPRMVVDFLNGEGTIDGLWFGEYQTIGGRPHTYWWRGYLPDAKFAAAPSAAQPGAK